MNQSELVKELATNTGLPQVGIENMLKALGSVAASELGAGGELTIPGIGKLTVATRAARTGRNPRTGEALQIAAKKVPHFSAAKALKDATA